MTVTLKRMTGIRTMCVSVCVCVNWQSYLNEDGNVQKHQTYEDFLFRLRISLRSRFKDHTSIVVRAH